MIKPHGTSFAIDHAKDDRIESVVVFTSWGTLPEIWWMDDLMPLWALNLRQQDIEVNLVRRVNQRNEGFSDDGWK